jgi:AbrB family looped-hinge helix DNA binding protein
MTSRVGPNGEVVIPKAIRDEVGLARGDEIAFAVDGATVLIRKVERPADADEHDSETKGRT